MRLFMLPSAAALAATAPKLGLAWRRTGIGGPRLGRKGAGYLPAPLAMLSPRRGRMLGGGLARAGAKPMRGRLP
jgi:hypothetical protein